MLSPRALLFDFNGTLSNDEPILCGIFVELFAEQGVPLSAQQYFDELAGRSDPEIVRTWLGDEHPSVDAVIEARIDRYRQAVADGSSITAEVRAAIRYAAERVPVGIVSGASRSEIEPVIEAAGLDGVVEGLVTADDVTSGKPDPEGYLRGLELLGDGIVAADVLVFEDTEAGIASAKAAGMPCYAVLGTLDPVRLRAADAIVPAIDVPLIRRLLE